MSYHQMVQSLKDLTVKWRSSRTLLLFIVFVALFLDNMLLTTIVPIIPDYLYRLEHPISSMDKPYPFLATNCSNNELVPQQSYFIWHPTQFRGVPCNQTIDRSINKTEIESQQRTMALNNENRWIGIMFASKAFVQLLTNPFIGPLTNRIGYRIPMFAGFVIMFLSTLIFACSKSFVLLFIARAVQGIGSACSSVSGLGMLADRYPDDAERGKAMGIALGGLGLGVLVGPPFGGFMYQYVGKASPFLVLAALGLFDGLLQLTVLQPSVKNAPAEGASLKTLIQDPYILLAAGAITLGTVGIAMLEPTLPTWMMTTMNASVFQQGAAFLPTATSYLIGTNLFGRIAHKMGRWLCCMMGMLLISVALICVPMATRMYSLIIPNSILGFAIGMVDASMIPTMGYLVDVRHSAVYGSVYAIADVAWCLGFAIGPAFSGFIVQAFGFSSMLYMISFICLCYAPMIFFLRNPPGREENISLITNENHRSLPDTRSRSLDNGSGD